MEITDLNEALKVFNLIEDKRDALRLAYQAKDGKLKEAKEQVEAFLLEEMRRLNLNVFGAPGEGEAKIKTTRHFGCADWGTFWTWVVETNRPNFLQKRLLDSEIQTYLEATGDLPPAVNSRAKLVIDVTKRPPKT